jgi:soluble lytic murein transglycosylase-like protein
MMLRLVLVLWALITAVWLAGCGVVPEPTPAPTAVVPVAAAAPAQIPHTAVVFRRELIQVWQGYFALAQPPAIGFAQIDVESSWRPEVVNAIGAAGLGQFMPGTAEWIETLLPADVQRQCDRTAGCPLDPHWAIAALCRYDWVLWGQNAVAAADRERWGFTLAGYNGGQGNVNKERARAQALGKPWRAWFDGVETVCLRSEAACRENRRYPRLILDDRAPRYRAWLGM